MIGWLIGILVCEFSETIFYQPRWSSLINIFLPLVVLRNTFTNHPDPWRLNQHKPIFTFFAYPWLVFLKLPTILTTVTPANFANFATRAKLATNIASITFSLFMCQDKNKDKNKNQSFCLLLYVLGSEVHLRYIQNQYFNVM